jgi:hypothetical protein
VATVLSREENEIFPSSQEALLNSTPLEARLQTTSVPEASWCCPQLQLGVPPGDPQPPSGLSLKTSPLASYSQRSPQRSR